MSRPWCVPKTEKGIAVRVKHEVTSDVKWVRLSIHRGCYSLWRVVMLSAAVVNILDFIVSLLMCVNKSLLSYKLHGKVLSFCMLKVDVISIELALFSLWSNPPDGAFTCSSFRGAQKWYHNGKERCYGSWGSSERLCGRW